MRSSGARRDLARVKPDRSRIVDSFGRRVLGGPAGSGSPPPRGGGLGRGGGSAGTTLSDDHGYPPPQPSPTRGEGELVGAGGSPFWTPDRHADRRPACSPARGRSTALRAWFRREGFVEVEPAALQVSPGNETHLHGFATEMIAGDGRAARAYLHTSPEFAMKKLLAAGETRIFAMARVFRNRERGGAACAGVHDGGMVSRRRGARRADARLRRNAAARGGGGGDDSGCGFAGARPIPSLSPSG